MASVDVSAIVTLPAILLTLLYGAACLGAAYWVCRLLPDVLGRGMVTTPGVTAVATLFLLGMSLVGAVLTLIGLAGWLRPGPITVLMMAGLAGLVIGRRAIVSTPTAFISWLRGWRDEPGSIRIVGFATALITLGFGAAALVRPPIGDAEAFYVAYAKIMASTGRLEPMPGAYAFFSTIGLPGELHFVALMALKDVHSAKLFVWLVALASAALLAAIAGACGLGRRGRLLSVAILFSSSTFTHYTSDGKVDLFAAAFGLAAFYWAVAPAKNGNARPYMPLVGLFAGAATVAKFSYLLAFGPALAVLLVWRCHEGGDLPSRERWKESAVRLAQVAIWACVAWIPQLIKNAALFDAPFAPFVGGPQDANWLQQVWFSPEVTRRIVLTYPFALVFGRYPMQGGGLSLLLVAFAPLVFLLSRPASFRKSLLTSVTIAAVVGTIAWVILRPSIIAPRYILATLLLFVPLVAKAAENAWAADQSPYVVRFGLLGTVAAALVAAAYHLLPIPGATLAYLSGRLNPCALASDYCAPLRELARVAAPGDRIFLGAYYGYWLRPDLLQCRDLPEEQRAIQKTTSGIEALRERGFRFVVIDQTSHAWVAERIAISAAESEGLLKQIVQTQSLLILELLPGPSHSATVSCSEVRSGEWKIGALR